MFVQEPLNKDMDHTMYHYKQFQSFQFLRPNQTSNHPSFFYRPLYNQGGLKNSVELISESEELKKKRVCENDNLLIPSIPSTAAGTNPMSLMKPVILIVGKGFVGNYLVKECQSRGIPVKATTRDGRDGTIRFDFDPVNNPNLQKQFQELPSNTTHLVITFPIIGKESMKVFIDSYLQFRSKNGIRDDLNSKSIPTVQWILLGTTSAWKEGGDRHNPRLIPSPRVEAEHELLTNPFTTQHSMILHLAGLWGGERQPRNWLSRIAKTKQDLAQKQSLHLIHGQDVARSILAVIEHQDPFKGRGERWMLTDLRVYDWWNLALVFSSRSSVSVHSSFSDVQSQRDGKELSIVESTENNHNQDEYKYGQWVIELMNENQVENLPRPNLKLGRTLNSLEFWSTFQLSPVYSL